jgi:RimJ/RimL family protein N-acetyltransferase
VPIPDQLSQPPTLRTDRLVLAPLGPEHFAGTWRLLQDPEVMRLTGTHSAFSEQAVRDGLAGLAAKNDRADWAITVAGSGEHVGEVVLNQLDLGNSSMSFRIALQQPGVFGQGYGTEATRAVVDYALDGLGLHRLQLEVFAFNPRARRVYEKCGFVTEGRRREALNWDGEWVDAITMAILATDQRLP